MRSIDSDLPILTSRIPITRSHDVMTVGPKIVRMRDARDSRLTSRGPETRLKRPNLETWHRLPEAVGDLRED